MEPNRFDNIVKEKLEQRTIQPREMAWDRLDAMLSVAEEKAAKPKKNRTWMYIAASFLGFLLLGTIFLKQGSNNTDVKGTETQIATTPEPAVNAGNTGIKDEIVIPVQEQVKEALAVTPASKTKGNATVAKPIKNKIVTAPETIVSQEAVAENTNAEIVNKTLTTEDPTLAVAEIDQSKKPSVKVNANSLLSSVEGELDNSFRAKAMQALVKNYNSVKTSVANRNHK